MKKHRLLSIIPLLFVTFLVLALVETLAMPTTTSADASAALEVPLTGSPTARSSETYENLIEIAFLALVGTGFYILNTRREQKR